MKLEEYPLRGWKFRNIQKEVILSDKIILLLKVDIESLGFKGTLKNLIAIDNAENIVWLAETPKGFTLSSAFDDIKYEGSILKAWKGDLYCEIDPVSGKILKELEIR